MEIAETRIIEGLLDPDIYPHPCTKVDLIQTHISWVFLTGLRVYKIKKPVNLGFVDFTSLERRKHFCSEEIRLNRRMAPDLYLDVVPITGSVEHPQIDGDGPVIEYAVRMRQFEKSHLLTSVATAELTIDRIEQLAADCASFHDRADAVPPDSQFGTPEAVLKPVVENFEAMKDCDDSTCETVADLRERVNFSFGRLIPAIKKRKSAGRVRECHGDLHLGNMFLEQDRITVFDGIEFNESLRWIDVISDIAFLVMDLTVRGHHDLANRFLNRWLEQTGDYDGLTVLPFYCSYRAAVRAKVDVIRIHQPDVSFSEQRHLSRDCCDYLKLAHQFLIRKPPSLTITMGLSGSGKTTVTDELIAQGDAIRIRSDVERKRMYGLGLTETSDDEMKSRMYSEQSTAAVYDRLRHRAATVIDAGYPVVVDATFLKRQQRKSFARLAEGLGVPFAIIYCHASENVLRQRIRTRHAKGSDPSEASEAVLDRQLAIVEPLDDSEAEYITAGSKCCRSSV